MNNEKMNFRISTGLKNIIGRELITSEVVAVFELVKNSFDANSKNVTIDLDLENEKIIILDDGIGMSKGDIENKWLFVAYSEKKDVNEKDGRKYVGAKGIGRFACDRLGSNIKIITRTSADKTFNILDIKWGAFEKNNLDEFENIPVSYSTMDNYSEIINSGTAIVINDLRDKWDYDRINKLKKSLEKLVNPFDSNVNMKIKLNIISKDKKLSELSSLIYNSLFDALKEKTTCITASFEDKIIVRLEDHGKMVYNIEKKNNDTGLSNIKICIYYLNFIAKYNFTRLMGAEPKNYGSIFMYKNKFRIYPYGEMNNDTLGLDTRKTQGYGRYLGNREIVGYISIFDSENKFIEASSRDRGFIENSAYQILTNIYMEYAHKPLEKYVNLINWGYDASDKKEITISDINVEDDKLILPTFIKDNDYNIEIDNNVLKDKAPIEKVLTDALSQKNLSPKDIKDIFKKSKETILMTKKIIQEQEKIVNNKDDKIIGLENQNILLKNLNKDEDILQAEVTHHISKMSNELDSCIENIAEEIDYNEQPEIFKELSRIKLISDKMRVFNQVILKGNFKSKGKNKINLYEYWNFYFNSSSYIASLSKTRNISIHKGVEFNYDCFNCDVDVYDISVIIDNLISNAIDLNATIIDACFEKNKIIFFSNTAQVIDENINKIFELGFSTKVGGTGIGLYQIKKILKKYNWNISICNKQDGVEFVIELVI
ncbi:MAG: ATP-binding protein [Bacilli bacterium]|nr:ATP-binding protein [Bacilli bacterium]